MHPDLYSGTHLSFPRTWMCSWWASPRSTNHTWSGRRSAPARRRRKAGGAVAVRSVRSRGPVRWHQRPLASRTSRHRHRRCRTSRHQSCSSPPRSCWPPDWQSAVDWKWEIRMRIRRAGRMRMRIWTQIRMQLDLQRNRDAHRCCSCCLLRMAFSLSFPGGGLREFSG